MNRTRCVILCAVGALAAIAVAGKATAQTAIVYVDGDSGLAVPNPPMPGDTWQNAYKYLQDALSRASDLVQMPQWDEVELWVAATDAENPYRPDRDANHPTGTWEGNSFEMLEDVALLGGFDGTETAANQRDAATNVTVLDGLDYWQGNPSYPYNSIHVVLAEWVDSSAMIDGFTIRHGLATMGAPQGDGAAGGGMLCKYSTPHVIRCTFQENTANYGGGMYVGGPDSPIVYNCSFIENHAISSLPCTTDGNGGGFANASGTVPLINCLFHSNEAVHRGGGIFNAQVDNGTSTVTLVNCTIAENHVTQPDFYAGGIFNGDTANIANCIFWGNTDDAGTGTGETAQI